MLAIETGLSAGFVVDKSRFATQPVIPEDVLILPQLVFLDKYVTGSPFLIVVRTLSFLLLDAITVRESTWTY